MRRTKTIVQGGIYHVIQRAPGRELIFLEDSDYLLFLHFLKEAAKEFDIEVFCFALLPNHIHLLLKISKPNLSEAMKSLFARYAINFNNKYQRKGHVFCGVYRASLCNDERYLIAVSIYIHLNPLKARLCREILDYRWSSVIPYIKSIKSTFIKPGFILRVLDDNLDKARREYRGMLRYTADIKFENILENKKAVDKFFVSFLKRLITKGYRSLSISHHLLDLEEQIEKFKNQKRLSSFQDKQALKYLIQQLKARGYSFKEIAQRLNFDRSTLYRITKCNI